MVALNGTYQNGFVKLEKNYKTKTPVKVIITFLEDFDAISEKVISLSDFSFSKSQKNLKSFKGSFGNAVIEERRKEV